MARVFVGLSGGVDSAVSAYMLKRAGHDVTGVFLKVWEPDFLPCTSADDRLDAMRVAAHLGIPFQTYDAKEEYRKGVVEYLLDEYASGRTPNPDVMCNRTVKFGIFWDKAKEAGAEYIATGHYAQNIDHALHRGVDEGKDQSYFLWTLTKDDLSHSLFPIGGLEKKEVRNIARAIKLPNAEKKDSQGICFLGHVDMKEFLKRYIPVEAGVARDIEGNVVGEHEGVALYTLGQRVSFSSETKLYVVGKNIHQNELVVSTNPTPPSPSREVLLRGAHWITEAPHADTVYTAQLRYHGEKYNVQVKSSNGDWYVVFEEPVLSPLGQSLVIYDGTLCLGGGVIEGEQ